MIFGNEEYKETIINILDKMPIVRYKQLLLALINSYEDMDEKTAESIVIGAQKEGRLLISEDGWVMTKLEYINLTNDKFLDGIHPNKKYRLDAEVGLYGNVSFINEKGLPDKTWGELSTVPINELIPKKVKDIIDCLWVVVDMMPESEDFVIHCTPWQIMFILDNDNDEENRLFQVIKLSKNNETALVEMIRNLPKVKRGFRKSISRIAILEDEESVWKIPRLGFTHIITLDDNVDKNYRIVSDVINKDDVWGDYE